MQNKSSEDFELSLKDYKNNIRVQDKYDYMPKIYTINFWHEFDYDASLYSSYFDVLEKAREEDEIIFYFNSGGGSIHTLNLFLNALKRCKSKYILARVNYAASAAALMALFCDNIEFNNHSTLMLHDFSTCLYGKGQEVESEFEHSKKQIRDLIRLILERILTSEELEQLFNGKDFYFDGKECIERLKRYAKNKLKKSKSKSASKNNERS